MKCSLKNINKLEEKINNTIIPTSAEEKQRQHSNWEGELNGVNFNFQLQLIWNEMSKIKCIQQYTYKYNDAIKYEHIFISFF